MCAAFAGGEGEEEREEDQNIFFPSVALIAFGWTFPWSNIAGR